MILRRYSPRGSAGSAGASLRTLVLASVGVTALCGAAAPAFSQTPAEAESSTGLQDIIVTARRQSESLMSVPVAASVVDSATLINRGISDMTGLARLVPQLSIEPALGAAGASFTIRGIGSSGTDAGTEQTVAVNFDGVQISRGQIIRQALFDLEQVEVLKGPQALFFGKNSPGGVLSVSSRGPTDHLEVTGKAGYEFNAQEKILEATVSGPLSETFGARLALRGTDMRGWMKNAARPIANPFASAVPGYSTMLPGGSYKHNGLKEAVGRLTLEYKPSTDFTATLRLFGSANEYKGDAASSEITHCGAPPLPQSAGVPDPFGDCKINGVQSNGALPEAEARTVPLFRNGDTYGRFTSYMASFGMDYSTGPLALTSMTGFVHYKQQVSDAVAKTVWSPTNWNASVDKFEQFSQEVRVVSNFEGPLNFTLGGYYEHNGLDTAGAIILGPHAPDPRTGSIATSEKRTKSRGNVYSAFGQMRWNVIETVELAGGVRYTKESKRGSAVNSFLNQSFPAGFIYAPEGLVFGGKTSDSNFSPEVTLSWRPLPRTTIYAAYKTGFKSGGFGAPTLLTANVVAGNQLVYKPEKAKGGEVGLKTMLFDNALRLTAAAFRYNYKDLQLSNFNAANFTQTINNVGGSRTQGFEAEALWRVVPQLTLHAAVGYARARYTSFQVACYSGQTPATGCNVAAGEQDLTGQALVRAPDWTGNLGFDYETNLTDTLKIGLNGDVRYSGKYFTQENNSPNAVQKKYAQIDAGIRVVAPDNRWRVSLIGRNLTDKSYAVSSFDNPNGPPGEIGSGVSRPRQIMVELGFSL